jgi:hypothetical protein
MIVADVFEFVNGLVAVIAQLAGAIVLFLDPTVVSMVPSVV